MTTPDSQEMGLLPCPFCGSQPKYHTHKGVWRMHHVYYCGTAMCPASHGPGPTGPACPTHAEHEAAIAAWNTRPREDAGVVDEWRPIETAPLDGTEVLVWCPDEALVPLAMHFSSRERFLREYGDADYMEEGWYLSYSYPDGMHEEVCRPTHWKHLPQPPALAAAVGRTE